MIDRNGASPETSTAAQIGGVDQSCACRVHFGYECIEKTVVGVLRRTCRNGKVRGTGEPGNIGVSRGVHRDSATDIGVAAAENLGAAAALGSRQRRWVTGKSCGASGVEAGHVDVS